MPDPAQFDLGAVPYATARERFADLVELAQRGMPVLVEGQEGSPDVVVVSAGAWGELHDRLEAAEATLETINDPEAMADIAAAGAPGAVWHTSEEIRDALTRRSA